MAETKFVTFKEMFPKGLNGEGKEMGSENGRETYLHVSDVVNLEIVVDKFDYVADERGETLYIHSDRGIIRTFSKMLINQAHTIDNKTGGKKVKLTIRSEKSKKNPMQSYYLFS